MTLNLQSWMRAVWTSLIAPAEVAAQMLALRYPRHVLWTGLALVAILNVLPYSVVQMIAPVPIVFDQQVITLTPFAYAVIMSAFLVLVVLTLTHLGRLMGGTGTLDGALMMIIWFQAINLTLKLIQLGLLFIAPGVAALFGTMILGATIWVLLNFVNVLHGFAHLGKAIVLIIGAFLGAMLGTGIVMTFLGVVPPLGEMT
ncbi:YIP1 family protein [Yoonia sp. BS5-3]|uniref:YIP1 family protein n=1 Tax=Yoonia phaeophyticola TaxID=3137369 RepID=A0ABZ2V449_9RHOB